MKFRLNEIMIYFFSFVFNHLFDFAEIGINIH
jgi:hypothetical protein